MKQVNQKKQNHRAPLLLVFYMALVIPLPVYADGSVVNKVYHPYVDALEKEIEYRSTFQDQQPNRNNPKQIHQLSFGSAIGQSWFGEFKLIADKSRQGEFDLEAFEFELKWQLSEQGEYSADWGVLFEYEQEFAEDVHEFKTGILVEKEFGRFSGAANVFFIQEWGSDIDDEFETALSLQARYRYSRFFEPAIEYYVGQDASGIGPVILGSLNFGVRKRLNWEAGVIFGASKQSPNSTFRFLLEYEF
ncbi:MAG: hypothetical protein COA96_10740 [SAR86 cluster bacterium]|uniref:Uncharacterized protein n=1 Tax=SAR86 cluster bacterium TaxID=2030880 RepID=A0A2A5AYN9_9GAMM|nr:MAG: hypothetical protein COA96_10740 [SAR86 cluster bacterium]